MAANKQLQFVKGSAILVLSNLVLKGINFFLLPLYTKYLTPGELGISDTITSVTAVIFPLLVMGLDSAFSAFYFDDRTKAYQNKVFNTILSALVVASVFPIIIAAGSEYIAIALFGTGEYALLVGISLISVTMNLWYLPFSLLVRMENRMTLFAVVNVVASLSMILLNVFFLSVFHLGVYALILSTTIIQLIQLVMYLIFGKAKLKVSDWDKKLMKRMFKYSLPLVPTVLASWVLNLSDRYIINFFCGEWEVGLYGIAARFGTIIALFANGVYMAYTTYAYDKKGEDDAQRQYSRILNAFYVVLLIACITISVYGKEVVLLMTEESYSSSYLMLIPLLFSQVLYGINTIVGYAIGFEKKSQYMFISTFTGAAVNVVLNFLFVPKYGAIAASYTTCISFAVMVVMTYVFAQKLYYVDYKINKIAITMAGTFAALIFIQDMDLIAKTVIWVCITVILVFLYKDVMKDYIVLIKKILHAGKGNNGEDKTQE